MARKRAAWGRKWGLWVTVGLVVVVFLWSHRPVSTLVGPCSICLPLSATSRRSAWPSLAQSPLFQVFFPSLIRFADPQCRYAVYLGVDVADRLLDQPDSELQLWKLLAPSLPSFIDVKLFSYNDTENRNVWAVNYVTEECFLDGYRFFLRVNDDSEFVTPWSMELASQLEKQRDMGVAGLWDRIMKRIFTHSMVGRPHFHAFRYHFPWVFGNWWSDDWITFVYPPALTFWSSLEINHRKALRRYDVDQSVESKLASTLQETSLDWRQWQKHNPFGLFKSESVSNHVVAPSEPPLCPWDMKLGVTSRRETMTACIRRAHHCRERANPDLLDPCAHLGRWSYERLWNLTDAQLLSEYRSVSWSKVSHDSLIEFLNQTVLPFRTMQKWAPLDHGVSSEQLKDLLSKEVAFLLGYNGTLSISLMTGIQQYRRAQRVWYSRTLVPPRPATS